MKTKRGITIFLVDDDPIYLSALSHLISGIDPHRVKVKSFRTGEDCLKELHLNPDIILLDYYLNAVVPEASNGMEILKKIKKIKPSTHVIFLSGKKRMGDEVLERGAYDYIYKSENVLSTIRNIIEDTIDRIEITQTLNESLGI